MNSCQVTYIYGLFEVGKEDEIRYIGKSDNPSKRLNSHIYTSLKKKNKLTHKDCWIKSVIKNNGKVSYKIIEETNYENWSEREIYWISNLTNLTNTSPGGETGITGKLFEISYIECKKWLNENYPNIKTIKDFRKVIKYFPEYIPKSPHTVFRGYGWISWSEFLNSDFITSKKKNKKYLTYSDCKKWVKDNFTQIDSWNKIKDSLPDFIPKRPYIVYRNSGWINWIDFIGVNLSPIEKYLDFEDVRKYVRDLKLSSSKDWYLYYKLNHGELKSRKIPRSPNTVYSNEGWSGWTEFLGSSIKTTDVNTNKMSYNQLCEYVKCNLNHIKTKRQWINYIKGKNLIDIPIHPDKVYKNEWIDWNSFLSKKEFKRNKKFFTFSQCKEIIKKSCLKSNKHWREWVKGVDGIPKNPENYFKEEWIDWYDWLGKEKV